MEYIDKIFYKKINPSDFKKLYDLDKPTTGGGQTYLDAAGIPEDQLVDFLSFAEKSDTGRVDETRFKYLLRGYTLGEASSQVIEFDPRANRKNYKISNQTGENKHPAWSPDNKFPEPNKDTAGNYISSSDFAGIIDHLVIFIVRTTYNKYYVGYINSAQINTAWPTDIGLEGMFKDPWRGVLTFKGCSVEFKNDLSNPFGAVSKSHINYRTALLANYDFNRIFFGAPGTGKSFSLNKEKDALLGSNLSNFERVTFHPDYTYSQFVGAYKPITNAIGEIEYKYVPGPFIRILVQALKNSRTGKMQPFVLVIEEINRAKVSAVFGEVFQLLDRDDDGVSEYSVTTSQDLRSYLIQELGNIDDFSEIRIPNNMFIWVTMNSADQGVFPVDTAFKRRWSFDYIGVDDEEFDITTNTKTGVKTATEQQSGTFKLADGDIEWNVLRRAINAKLSSDLIKVHEDKLMGPFFLKTQRTSSATNTIINNNEFKKIFCNKVLMYLFEDAAKTKRKILFAGCGDNCNRYSYLCKEFETKGLGIFGPDFRNELYAEQESERNKAKFTATK